MSSTSKTPRTDEEVEGCAKAGYGAMCRPSFCRSLEESITIYREIITDLMFYAHIPESSLYKEAVQRFHAQEDAETTTN